METVIMRYDKPIKLITRSYQITGVLHYSKFRRPAHMIPSHPLSLKDRLIMAFFLFGLAYFTYGLLK